MTNVYEPSAAGVDETAPPPEDPGVTSAPTDVQASSGGSKIKTPKKKGRVEATDLPPDAPTALGGYQVLKRLGEGGMGTVYLARQISLDRNVALKTMKPQWADIPRFLARFTREAYAAAQLVHHNIVQIYDIGEDKGTPFFSMEFVKGSNLGDLLKDKGKLDVEEAIGYILQAARGLKFAHDQGMVHRDIKPDNLMLNDQGIVKVADLGLVKTPEAAAAEDAAEEGAEGGSGDVEVTAVGVAMGTPAYMAPEQGTNAAGVDHRADIYSLGCTLYILLTGRPPFQGKTAMEVITKHQSEPIVRPEVLVKRVPKRVSDILLKMLAKKPQERYADLDAVIRDLEGFLGVQSVGPFTPSEEHASTLEQAARDFNAAPAARLRKVAAPLFLVVMGLACLVTLFSGRVSWFSYAAGLAVFTALFTFVVSGLHSKSYLFLKVRELVLDSSWTDWLMLGVGVVVVVGALKLLGTLWIWGVIVLLAAGLAALYHLLIDRRLEAEREEPLQKAQQLLKTMRLKGLEEAAVQQFVCKYSGDHWEELFETLFGYELLLQARKLWGTAGGRRPHHFMAWRDPLVRWIEGRQKARKEARERKLLAKLEQKSLQAKGLSAAEAREQAQDAAEALVSQAAAIKQEVTRFVPSGEGDEARAPQPPRLRIKQMLAEARAQGAAARQRRPRPNPVRLLIRTAFSPKVRFLAGAALLAACLVWADQNALLNVDKLSTLAEGNETVQTELLGRLANAKPLHVPTLPDNALAPLFQSLAPGMAGILLILASFGSSRRFILFCTLGALVSFFGPLVPLSFEVPLVSPDLVKVFLWPAAGLAVAAIGVLLRLFEK
jgi:hypothetical protein